MKSILNFLLGVALGIITIRLAIVAAVALAHASLLSAGILGLIAFGIGLFSIKCFKKI